MITVEPTTTIAAIRIAHVLNAPIIGRKMSMQGGLDVYLRYAIERTFEEEGSRLEGTKHHTSRLRDASDLSFHLRPHDRYQRALQLLQEVNPGAIASLVRFHDDRLEAMWAIKQWWRTGVRSGRVLRSSRSPSASHSRTCKRRFDAGRFLTRHLPKLEPNCMVALAKATTKMERAKDVGAILAGHAKGCKGCLARLEAVYMSALRSFNVDFPTIPK